MIPRRYATALRQQSRNIRNAANASELDDEVIGCAAVGCAGGDNIEIALMREPSDLVDSDVVGRNIQLLLERDSRIDCRATRIACAEADNAIRGARGERVAVRIDIDSATIEHGAHIAAKRLLVSVVAAVAHLESQSIVSDIEIRNRIERAGVCGNHGRSVRKRTSHGIAHDSMQITQNLVKFHAKQTICSLFCYCEAIAETIPYIGHSTRSIATRLAPLAMTLRIVTYCSLLAYIFDKLFKWRLYKSIKSIYVNKPNIFQAF